MFAPRGWFKRPSEKRTFRLIRDSALFDRKGYGRKLGVRRLLYDPLWHYLDKGWKLGWNPSEYFDNSHYTNSYPDIRKANVEPLSHFLEFGQAEQRRATRWLPQAFAYFFPNAEELPTFRSPHNDLPRLTTVVDDSTLRRKVLSLPSILDLSLNHARQGKRQVRLIFRGGETRSLGLALSAHTLGETPLDVVYQRPGGKPIHYPIHEGEKFLATSWTSLASLRFTTEPSNVFYVPNQELREEAVELTIVGASAPSSESWRTWALRQEIPRGDLVRSTRRKQIAIDGEISRIILVVSDSSATLRTLLVLRELENLQVLLSQKNLTLEVALTGLDIGPLGLLGGPLKILSLQQVRNSGTRFDCALVIQSNPATIEFFQAAGTYLHPVMGDDLVEAGELTSQIHKLLRFVKAGR